LLNLEEKKAIVADLNAVAASAPSAVAAEYRGLTVSEMTELRSKAREAGVFLKVVKNTLARRAVEGTEYECLKDSLVGPIILAFSSEEPAAAARVVKDFSKEHDKLVVKAAALGSTLMEDIDKLAKMPTRDEAISMLMSVMQAPISKLVRTIAEPNNKMVRTIAAVRDSKSA